MKVGPVKVVGLGLLTLPVLLVLVALVLGIGGVFWGWIIMLAWPVFASTTIGFAKAFWMGVVATVIVGVFSK